MKKYYTEPELEIRNYVLLPGDAITTSSGDSKDPNLNDGENNSGGGLL